MLGFLKPECLYRPSQFWKWQSIEVQISVIHRSYVEHPKKERLICFQPQQAKLEKCSAPIELEFYCYAENSISHFLFVACKMPVEFDCFTRAAITCRDLFGSDRLYLHGQNLVRWARRTLDGDAVACDVLESEKYFG